MRAQSIFFLSTLLAIVPFLNPVHPTGSSDVAHRSIGHSATDYRGSGRLDIAYRGSGRIETAYRGSGRLTVG